MKNKILGLIVFILAIVVLFSLYKSLGPSGGDVNVGPDDNGSITFPAKQVSVELIGIDGESEIFTLSTHASTLKGVMDEIEGFEYVTKDGMVMEIGGVRADYVLDGAYWAFFVNGDYCNYGISDQPVNDGDAFAIIYTKA